MTFVRPAFLAVAAVLLAGCGAARAPQTASAEPGAVERAVMRYYETHATEQNRTCLSPFMYGVTRIDVVEQGPERLVVDVRYLYRDRNMDDRSGFGRECTGYAQRRFTLQNGAAGLEVLDMSGPGRTG